MCVIVGVCCSLCVVAVCLLLVVCCVFFVWCYCVLCVVCCLLKFGGCDVFAWFVFV